MSSSCGEHKGCDNVRSRSKEMYAVKMFLINTDDWFNHPRPQLSVFPSIFFVLEWQIELCQWCLTFHIQAMLQNQTDTATVCPNSILVLIFSWVTVKYVGIYMDLINIKT